MTRVITRARLGIAALLLAMTPIAASAQTGRLFVSAEAYVGMARAVHVGKIVSIERVEYDKPLTDMQKLGKPYRVVFDVRKTIRGEEAKRLELVLSLQNTLYLDYLRDHAVVLMLAAGPTQFRRHPAAEIGIEAQGKRVDGDRYDFRLLDPLTVPDSGDDAVVAAQINKRYDGCRMFTSDFELIAGSDAILKRVRAFAMTHDKSLPAVMLRVPNEFGALCGDPNAYCGISLPVCPETKATLLALKADPGLILRRIESRDEDYNRSMLVSAVDKALAEMAREVGE